MASHSPDLNCTTSPSPQLSLPIRPSICLLTYAQLLTSSGPEASAGRVLTVCPVVLLPLSLVKDITTAGISLWDTLTSWQALLEWRGRLELTGCPHCGLLLHAGLRGWYQCLPSTDPNPVFCRTGGPSLIPDLNYPTEVFFFICGRTSR